jgi:hypothetical protein
MPVVSALPGDPFPGRRPRSSCSAEVSNPPDTVGAAIAPGQAPMKALFRVGAIALPIAVATISAKAECFGGNVGIYYVICPLGSFPGNPVGVLFPPFDVNPGMRPGATNFPCRLHPQQGHRPHCRGSDSEPAAHARSSAGLLWWRPEQKRESRVTLGAAAGQRCGLASRDELNIPGRSANGRE